MKHRILPFLLAVCLLAPQAVGAQTASPTDYPTATALAEAVVPQRDLIDLARRLNGLEAVPPPPVNPPPLTVGTVRTMWADNASEDYAFQFEAELVAVGEHIYLWQQRGANLDRAALEQLAADFDANIYYQTRALWGEEASPGVDGDPRIHGVFVGELGFGVGAYYANKHSYPVEAVPTSNEGEMLFYNLDTISGLVGTPTLTTITAHEFQHMIRANVDGNEDGWIDEGFSSFTEWYLGDRNASTMNVYLSNPSVQLNTWTEVGNRTADYGASQLWVTYLYEQFGEDGLRTLSADPANGFFGVDNLAAANNTDADTLFGDWVVANYLLDPSRTGNPAYGYTQLTGIRPAATVQAMGLPFERTQTVNQYAAQYIQLSDPAGARILTVQVSAPGAVGLADTKSPTATPMWYSNRGDDSNTTVTFPVDLTDTTAPTLSYDVWYHIENLWDYGYLMASNDGGSTWDILTTPNMTDENPHFTAFGAGYTGRSDGWLRELVDLSAYAGDEVLLRFEMIYDDAVNQPGMFIDAVRVADGDDIRYATDFGNAATLADWEAAGWVLTDNRLPQSVWVQAIIERPDGATVTRWRYTGGQSEYLLTLPADATAVTFALAPFASTTTVPTEITLSVR